MKTIVTFATTVMLVAGAISATASGMQGSNEAPDYQLSVQAARNFGGVHASARISAAAGRRR